MDITIHGDVFNGDKVGRDKITHHHAATTDDARDRNVILVMSANADPYQPLRIDEERRAISREVAHSRAAERLEVRTADALRLDDLSEVLLRHAPVIAHFSGHGHPDDGIQVFDDHGRARSVPPRALAGLFRVLGSGVRCVVLNACYTDVQAEAIAAHVPCVVGMHRPVLDDTAILFSTAFYRGIANARSLRTSFDLARNELILHQVADEDAPRLIARGGGADAVIAGA